MSAATFVRNCISWFFPRVSAPDVSARLLFLGFPGLRRCLLVPAMSVVRPDAKALTCKLCHRCLYRPAAVAGCMENIGPVAL